VRLGINTYTYMWSIDFRGLSRESRFRTGLLEKARNWECAWCSSARTSVGLPAGSGTRAVPEPRTGMGHRTGTWHPRPGAGHSRTDGVGPGRLGWRHSSRTIPEINGQPAAGIPRPEPTLERSCPGSSGKECGCHQIREDSAKNSRR